MKKFLLFIFSFASILVSIQSNAQCSISAVTDTTVCSKWPFRIQAHGTGYTTYEWTTSGTGSFDYTYIYDNGLTAYYVATPEDIASGTINLSMTASGNCATKTIISKITFYAPPIASINAGQDQTSCGAVTLNATVINAKAFNWVTLGTGTFANISSPSTTYTPSLEDQLTGSTRLWAVIDATDAICGFENDTDEVVINYLPPNVVNAGPDLASCKTSTVTISGSSLLNATGVIWSSSGTGTFSSTTDLHPTYYPSPTDSSTGSVKLMVRTTGNGSCQNGLDTLQLTIFNNAPTVNAGPDQLLCQDKAILKPIYTGTNGIIWSTSGTGTFSANATTNTTVTPITYTPSIDDFTDFSSQVTLTATTISNGVCPTASDNLILRITSNAGLNVGTDTVVCPNSIVYPVAQLQAGTVIWTTSGTGTFSDPTSLTPAYTPSAADKTNGAYWLTATTSGANWCPSQSGTKRIFLTTVAAEANAGADQTICGSMVALNGKVTNATGGIWTTSGTGTFNPSANYLNTSYLFSSADVTAGVVTLTLTTTGMCEAPSTDVIQVTTLGAAAPSVHAGPDQIINGTSVSLNGTSFGTSTILWFSSGTGTFSNSSALSTIYTPSTLDLANGLVYLTLSGTTHCYVSDVLSVKFGVPFALTGTIKAATNTLDKGMVSLYKKESSGLFFVETDTLMPSDMGAYTFDLITAGTYIVLATPFSNSIFQNNFLPTYLGGTQDWSTAQQITISGISSYDISLTPYTSAVPNWNTGKDTIAGTVYVNQSSATARIQSTPTPAAYATVYLTDASGNKIAYTQTDVNGRYKFVNVEAGKYAVSPNYAGTNLSGTAASLPVTVDGNPATVEDGSMTLEQKVSTTTGILSAVKSAVLTAYPNPAKSSVTVNLTTSAGNGIVKLMNENGTVVLQQQMDLSGSSITLNIESLSAGMYILQLVAEDEVYTSKVIKY